MRILLDTNVIIAGTISNGLSSQIVEETLSNDDIELFTSHDILKEYRKKLKERPEVGTRNRIDVKRGIRASSTIKNAENKLDIVEDDPDDNKFFEVAEKVGADFIVSGDDHLHQVSCYEGIHVLETKETVLEMMKSDVDLEIIEKQNFF